MVYIFILFLLFGSSAAVQYNAYAADDAYHFNVVGYGLRAKIDHQNRLKIYGPRFSRVWSLPHDANIKTARTFRKGNVFRVSVPRITVPKPEGGEVPRGTTIHFAADHVCATFDGSEPVCGKPCQHGQLLKDFVVSEDEVILKLRTCQANLPSETVIYHAFDPDIIMSEESYNYPDEIVGKHGWFDRHGNERPY